MLTRKTAETLPAILTLTGQGESVTFKVTYHNRKQAEVEKAMNTEGNTIADVVLFLVKQWDVEEYPLSLEGLAEMEADRPGLIYGIIEAFHEARRFTATKNLKPQ